MFINGEAMGKKAQAKKKKPSVRRVNRKNFFGEKVPTAKPVRVTVPKEFLKVVRGGVSGTEANVKAFEQAQLQRMVADTQSLLNRHGGRPIAGLARDLNQRARRVEETGARPVRQAIESEYRRISGNRPPEAILEEAGRLSAERGREILGEIKKLGMKRPLSKHDLVVLNQTIKGLPNNKK